MDGRRVWLMVLGAGWVMTWFASLVMVPWASASFESGIWASQALGWQGVAAMLSVAIWGVGRSWPKGAGVRRGSAMPLAASALVALGMGAAWLLPRI